MSSRHVYDPRHVPAAADGRRVAQAPHSPRQRSVLALQSKIGNRAVSRIVRPQSGGSLLMRTSTVYTGRDRELLGRVTIKEDPGLITAQGTVLRPPKQGPSSGIGVEEVVDTPVTGSIDYHPDRTDKTRWVIGTMRSEPKRTGVGMLLAYHLAKAAKAAGVKTIGTDLSALEEGTPEFYQAIGLTPSAERIDLAMTAVADMPTSTEAERQRKAKKQKDIMYSARLDADVDVVLRLTGSSFEKYWTADGSGVVPK